jgi:hypothetical protein
MVVKVALMFTFDTASEAKKLLTQSSVNPSLDAVYTEAWKIFLDHSVDSELRLFQQAAAL